MAAPFLLFRVLHLLQEIFLLGLVSIGIEEDALGGQSVPSGPPCFLVVAFQVFWQVVVDHETYVRLVDAHAEGDGRHHYGSLVADEPVLHGAACFRFQPSMVCLCPEASPGEGMGHFFRGLAGNTVDNGRLAAVFFQQGQQRVQRMAFELDGVGQVGTVEAGDEHPGFPETQLRQDVFPYRLGSGGREGNGGSVGANFPQRFQFTIGRAEVMTPVGDAVGFVDGDELDIQLFQKGPKLGQHGPLRGYVQDTEPVLPGHRLDLHNLRLGQRAVDEAGRDAVGAQAVNLVFHQGDERRNHQGQPAQGQRGQLVA